MHTTQQPEGTLIVGAFGTCTRGNLRRVLRVATNSSGDNWESNITAILAEERVCVAVTRPAGLCKMDLTRAA